MPQAMFIFDLSFAIVIKDVQFFFTIDLLDSTFTLIMLNSREFFVLNSVLHTYKTVS